MHNLPIFVKCIRIATLMVVVLMLIANDLYNMAPLGDDLTAMIGKNNNIGMPIGLEMIEIKMKIGDILTETDLRGMKQQQHKTASAQETQVAKSDFGAGRNFI